MAQAVEIYGRNLEITERIQDYVDKKVAKLDRFLTDIDETRVDLAHVKSARNAADRQVAQITVRGRGYVLRSEERADDIFAAFDTALDKMQRRIERFKGKHLRGRGDGKPASEVAPSETASVVEEVDAVEIPVIVRRKHFQMDAMDEMEAIEQMELLGHESFFVFYNATNRKFNVLYRRRDGTYGLIEPDIA